MPKNCEQCVYFGNCSGSEPCEYFDSIDENEKTLLNEYIEDLRIRFADYQKTIKDFE